MRRRSSRRGSRREALRSATLAPAQFLGIAAMAGSVAVGKRASLVLLDADPARAPQHAAHRRGAA